MRLGYRKPGTPLEQQFARLGLKIMRWLCFIPAGFSVGGIFSAVIAFMFGPLGFSITFGFSVTAFGAHVAPSEKKKIPGLIITFSIVLLALSGLPEKSGLSETHAIVLSVVTILTSFITALRLKPVKGADFLKEDPGAPFNAKPQASEKALENAKDMKVERRSFDRSDREATLENVKDTKASEPPETKPEAPPDLIAVWDVFIQYSTRPWQSRMELLGIFGIGLLLSIHKNVSFWLPVGYTVVFALAIFVAPRFVRFLPFIAICISCYIRYFATA